MDLFDNFSCSKINDLTKDLQRMEIQTNFILLKQKLSQIQSLNIHVNTFLQKALKHQILSSIKFHSEKQLLAFKYTLSAENLLQTKNQYQKNMIQKYFLQLNYTNIFTQFTINPLTHQLILQNKISIPLHTCFTYLINDLILENLIHKKTIIKNHFNQIKYLLNLEILPCSNMIENSFKKQNTLNNLKRFIHSSKYYSWSILGKITQKKIKQNNSTSTYSNTKRLFRQLKRSNPTDNIFIDRLSQVRETTRPRYQPFVTLTINQDNQLKNKYLSKNISVCKESNQISQLQLTQNQINKFNNRSQLYLNTNNGQVKVHIQKIKQNQDLDYEIQILKEASPLEFKGIPKFYVIKNQQEEGNKHLVTNLVGSKEFSLYLQSNKQTMSIYTKLNLLSQICLIIKYLRDYCIVYNNLRPQNIKIKKGIVKILNFSNSFHPIIHKKKKTHFEPYFPYVSLFENSVLDDQRSDVFSLGVLAFYMILGNNHINIKQSSYKRLDKDNKLDILKGGRVCRLQKIKYVGNEYIRLLFYMFIMCITHNLTYERSEDGKSIVLSDRPYLDWVVIIMKYTIQSYQTIL